MLRVLFVLFLASSLRAAEPAVVPFLEKGDYAGGEKELSRLLQMNPKDDQARFGLGTLRFMRSVEKLGQALHRHGIRMNGIGIPILRLPVPENTTPEELTYEKFRGIFDTFRQDLSNAETALAGVTDDQVALPINLVAIKMAFAEGKPPAHVFQEIGEVFFRDRVAALRKADGLLIRFDRGDVAWMRGYCHLLQGICELVLSFDLEPLFDAFGSFLFPKVKGSGKQRDNPLEGIDISQPERLKRAREHWIQMAKLSKETWKHILAETDDENEFLPNPKQKGVFGVPVTKEMIDTWLAMMEEVEQVLEGKKLARYDDKLGMNIKKMMDAPPKRIIFADYQKQLADYLEKGPMTDPELQRRIDRVFGGEFMGFAMWFN